jgi:hypothetical protein
MGAQHQFDAWGEELGKETPLLKRTKFNGGFSGK